ncbi:uncharacterized protein N7458_011760 [Penicillium daleae]|uniref:Uncharacterized protein n=1 Tax=Penicillium daleae TaxID=63821 RepID=A0AAD6BTA4_9EURO|nr:uncharacterized protein N7458_011760 [Penicillium daleae]KAJ5432604.1 hypothetical protein N7458_011760 [Penicillium daleae]
MRVSPALLCLFLASISRALNNEGSAILRRNAEIEARLADGPVYGVRKMSTDEGEKFYLEYWHFEDAVQGGLSERDLAEVNTTSRDTSNSEDATHQKGPVGNMGTEVSPAQFLARSYAFQPSFEPESGVTGGCWSRGISSAPRARALVHLSTGLIGAAVPVILVCIYLRGYSDDRLERDHLNSNPHNFPTNKPLHIIQIKLQLQQQQQLKINNKKHQHRKSRPTSPRNQHHNNNPLINNPHRPLPNGLLRLLSRVQRRLLPNKPRLRHNILPDDVFDDIHL